VCRKEETDSEEDVSENEGGEKLTPAPIFRTLVRIKQKDPAIYEVERGCSIVCVP